MAITYNPQDASNCLAEGEYDAVLKKVESRMSQAGNEMDVLSIEVYGGDGRKVTVTEYITAAAVFKLKQLAVAVGKRAAFDAGDFQADDAVGDNFRVALTIEQQDGYDDKNRVGKFLPSQSQATLPTSAKPRGDVRAARPVRAPAPHAPIGAENAFKDDEIPF